MPKKNLYTAVKKALTQPPHKDTGNNNLYTALGLKPKKTEAEREAERKKKENEKIKKQTKKRVDEVKK